MGYEASAKTGGHSIARTPIDARGPATGHKATSRRGPRRLLGWLPLLYLALAFWSSQAFAQVSISPATANLPDGYNTLPYNQTLTASGGVAPYTFSVSAGGLPPGLVYSTAGVISGTPTVVNGNYDVTFTVFDGTAATGTRTYRIKILPASAAPGAPTATIVVADTALRIGETSLVTFTFSRAVTGFTNADLTIANGTLSAVSSSDGGITWTATLTPSASITDPTNVITLNNAGVTSTTGTPGTGTTNSNNYAIDTLRPTATVVVADTALTAGETSLVTITYSEAVTGFSNADLTIPNGTLSAVSSSNGGITWTATFTPTAGIVDASNVITLANTGVTDAAGNTGTGTTDSNNYAINTATAPGAPIIGTATAGNAQATVTFAVPASNGGAAITSYTVTSSPGGITASGAASPIIVTGLTNGTAYTFTVTATNGAGTGPASAASNSVTPQGPQTITFDNPGTQNFGTSPTLAATASSGLPVTFTSSTAAVCTITAGGTLTAVSPGTCTVSANQAGNAAFTAAPTVTQSFAIVVPGGSISITTTTSLPPGAAGVPYNQAITATGGAAPYFYSLVAGALPAGLTFSSSGVLSGTPTVAGTFNFSVEVRDSASQVATQPFALVISAPTIILAPTSLPGLTGGEPFSQAISASGGVGAYSYSLTAGALPPGMALSSAGTLSGTPTAAGTFNLTITATDSLGFTGSQAYTMVVAAPTFTIEPPSLPDMTAGVAFSETFYVSGGVGAYTYSLASGALPTGMVLSGGGVFLGTPTVAGAYSFTVRVTDPNGFTGEQAYSFDVVAPTITIAPATLPDMTAGVAFSDTFAASGGTGPYSYSLLSGSLPVGMSMSSGGVFSGTPTVANTYGFTVRATDANGFTGDQAYSFDVVAPTITLAPATLPDQNAGIAFSETITAAGGTAPYSYSLLSGALPVGVSFSSAGVLSGTPLTAGSFTFTIRATDGNGFTGDQAYAFDVIAPTITLAPATLPDQVVGIAFSETITAAGGTAPYSYSLLSGALPIGVSFSSAGALSGTPRSAGAFSLTIRATDANGFSGDQAYSFDVAAPTIVLAPATLPDGSVGDAYSQAISASGGIAPYSYSIVSGALPPGLAFSSAGALSGTPTTAGAYAFRLRATDDAGFTAEQDYTITIAVDAPVVGAVAATLAYNAPATPIALALSGGAASSVAVATAPAHGSATASGTGISYAPNAGFSGTDTFTYTASNASGTSAPATVTITVGAPVIDITGSGPATGTVGAAYSQSFSFSGGAAPYGSYAVTGLPAGVTVTASTADSVTVSGTPTAAGSFTLNVSGTDSSSGDGPFNASESFALAIAAPSITLAPTTLPDGVLGTAYTQAVSASGGTAPYSYAVTSGVLPAGLALAADGTLSGTPTAAGTASFTVTATDALGFTGAQALTLAIAIDPPVAGDVSATLAYNAPATPITLALSGGAATSVTIATAPANGTATASGTGISYAPNAGFSGSDSFTYTASNASGTSAPATVTITVGAPVIAIAGSGPATGTVGSAYSQTFSFSGGTAPYGSYAVTGLPAGVTVTASTADSVTVSGTPTAAGSFTLNVSGADSSSGDGPFTASEGFALAIAAPTITVTPATLVDGSVGDAYTQAITASGGTAPYTYAVTSGTLPAGIALTADGTLSGTPTAAGSFAFTVTATDAYGATGARAYALAIAAPSITLAPTTLPDGVVGTAYTQAINASGGTAPYSYALTTGTLPAGLTLAADGTLSGTPTTAGTAPLTITATDALGYTGTLAVSLTIGQSAPVATADATTTLTGQAVNIAVTANDSGTIDGIAITRVPAHGTATIDGLEVVYTPAAGFDGNDSFAYAATGPGGASAPAEVAVTVHPVPVAQSREVDAMAGVPVSVVLTEGATGGPFTAATLVSLSPANAGTASIRAVGNDYVLDFLPDGNYSGTATVRFTLANAYATSAEATVEFNVVPRPDPSADPEVRGLLDAQAASARRFASAQMDNFQRRLERMHGAGAEGGFDNAVSFAASRERCRKDDLTVADADCRGPSAGEFGQDAAADAAAAAPGNGNASRFGVWTGGVIRSGNQDGRNGSAGVDFETDGFSVGADYRLNPDFAFGGGFGYGTDDSDIGEAGSRVEGEAWSAALYASYHPGGRFFVDGLVGYQRLRYDLRRYLTGVGGFVDGNRDGTQWFASVSAGADIVRDAMQITPYVRLDTAQARLDPYTESGHPVMALRYGTTELESTTGNLGLRMDFDRRMSWGTFTPQLRMEFQHEFQGDGATTLQYADLLGGPIYRAEHQLLERNRFMIGLGLQIVTNRDLSLRFEYRSMMDGENRDHGVLLQIEKGY